MVTANYPLEVAGQDRRRLSHIPGHARRHRSPHRCHGGGLGAKGGDLLPFKEVFKAIGITSHDFRCDVRAHPDFVEAVSELGVGEFGKGRNHAAFRLVG